MCFIASHPDGPLNLYLRITQNIVLQMYFISSWLLRDTSAVVTLLTQALLITERTETLYVHGTHCALDPIPGLQQRNSQFVVISLGLTVQKLL